MIQSWLFGWVPWTVGIHVSSSSTQSEQHPVTNTYATNKAPTTTALATAPWTAPGTAPSQQQQSHQLWHQAPPLWEVRTLSLPIAKLPPPNPWVSLESCPCTSPPGHRWGGEKRFHQHIRPAFKTLMTYDILLYEYWLPHRDPYNGFIIIPTIDEVRKIHPKQPG